MIEFQAFDKIPRLFRDMTVTEKIDGTNAALGIAELGEHPSMIQGVSYVTVDGTFYSVHAQSRKRLITPEADNFGFAAWVFANAPELARVLGPGLHFGEWWGSGIQRGYGLTEKRFSLFNTHRWGWLADERAREQNLVPPQLHVVPVLEQYRFDTEAVQAALDKLEENGSYAAPGFMKPEGVVVYHSAGNHLYKATFEMDAHKSQLELAA